MQLRKLLGPVLLLLAFVVTAKADSITLNVTSWSYGSFSGSDSTSLTINAVDSNGKTIAISYFNNLAGGITRTNEKATVIGFPYTTATSAISVRSGIDPLNGTINFLVNSTPPLPPPSAGTTTAPATLGGTISSTTGQSLSFSLTGGLATFSYNFGGLFTSISIAGTGGTVTIDVPPAPVPEPATLLLLGSGLAALGLKARRRKQ